MACPVIKFRYDSIASNILLWSLLYKGHMELIEMQETHLISEPTQFLLLKKKYLSIFSAIQSTKHKLN